MHFYLLCSYRISKLSYWQITLSHLLIFTLADYHISLLYSLQKLTVQSMKYLFVCSLTALFLSIISCAPSRKPLVAPVTIIHVPDSLPALPSSEIDITLKAPGRLVLAKADSVVPRQFTSDSWPNYLQPSCDFRYKYRFFRSGLTITCVNNMIGVHLTGTYQISGGRCLCTLNKPVSPWVSGSCGFGNEPLRRVNINISSQLSFLPGYRIVTASKAGKLDAIDKCSVSFSPRMLHSRCSTVSVPP